MKKTFNFFNAVPKSELVKFYNSYTNLSQINVIEGTAGLGRQAANNDKISGILSYNAAGLPSGFSGNPVIFVTSLSQAETAGILSTGSYQYEHYQVSEFFRLNPEGWLYIGIYTTTGSFADMASMVQLAQGTIRQLGVFAWGHAFSSSDVTALQSAWATIPVGYQQFSILYAPDFSSITPVTGWGTIDNLRLLNAPKVTVVIAQDGNGKGKSLFTTGTKSVQALGAALGAISSGKVSWSIGNPAQFPITDGIELATLALANGDLISAVGYNTLDALLGDGYLIARQYLPDISGSFFENCPTSVPLTNNFAWIQIVRAVDKLIRGIRVSITPYLNYQIGLNADGTMSNPSLGFFKDLADTPAQQMVSNGELSAAEILIDPTQNILSTNKLVISAICVPIATASQITVNIDLATQLPSS